uniref:PBPe domain-containing protein n=1 Tax=Caenorhabditis tropicalis TaxID=1561998 RepID=A0A1I7TSS3_9PELO
MIMVASYTANLAAFLVLDQPEKGLTGVTDPRLRNPSANFSFGTVLNSNVYQYFKRHVELSSMFRKMEPHNVHRASEAVHSLLNGSLDAFIWDSTRLEFEAARHCELRTRGSLFGRSAYGIGLQKNSPWTPHITSAILRMSESGVMENLDQKWIDRGGPNCVVEAHKSPARLGLVNMKKWHDLSIGTKRRPYRLKYNLDRMIIRRGFSGLERCSFQEIKERRQIRGLPTSRIDPYCFWPDLEFRDKPLVLFCSRCRKKTRHQINTYAVNSVSATPPPAVAPTSHPPSKQTSSQAGWDYWTRVYSDDSLAPPASRDVRISDMLSSDSLVRAKLLFLNVPSLPTAHKNIILNLVKRELHDEVSIQDVVVVPPGKWFLNFYRPEDALKVLKYFNGYSYRGYILAVRFCYPDGTYGDEAALAELVQCSNTAKGRLFEQKEIVQNTLHIECWFDCEYEALQRFETELINLLKTHAYLPYHNVLQSLRTHFSCKPFTQSSSVFISDALTFWPTGLIRVFNRNVKVISNTICLSTSSFYTQRIHDSAMEGGCPVHRNSWEPTVPDEIRSEVQLIQYALAFLGHFGPQHIDIDAPIRILAQSLRGTWPKSGPKLAARLTEISSGFVLVNRVLYLSSNQNHHEK